MERSVFKFEMSLTARPILASVLIILCASCQANHTHDLKTSSKKYLLDKDMSQFKNVYDYGTAEYENNILALSATGNWFYLTKNKYKNFIFYADVKMPDVSEYSNAGIIFRAQVAETDKGKVAIGYQAEVDPSARKWSGGLYDQGRRQWLYPVHKERSFPDEKFEKNFLPPWSEAQANAYNHLQWNQYRIEARGSEIKIFVNDILTTHVLDTTDAEGYIGLQHHGSKKLIETGSTDNIVQYRNVYIEVLD
jgi:hypothetical protein